MNNDRIPERDLQMSTMKKKKFGKNSEMIERFCFVISVSGLNGPNIGKDDGGDDDDDDDGNDDEIHIGEISRQRNIKNTGY
jgi:hypothetical protein